MLGWQKKLIWLFLTSRCRSSPRPLKESIGTCTNSLKLRSKYWNPRRFLEVSLLILVSPTFENEKFWKNSPKPNCDRLIWIIWYYWSWKHKTLLIDLRYLFSMNNNSIYLFIVNFNFYVVTLTDKVFEYLSFLCTCLLFIRLFSKLYISGFCDNSSIIFFMSETTVSIYVNETTWNIVQKFDVYVHMCIWL